MKTIKLLTPGPLTTSDMVRHQMMSDRCTWDDDYKSITQRIRRGLLDLAGVTDETHTIVLMQGSGSFGVEATLNTVLSKEDTCLFIVNGAYGKRMVQMADYMGRKHVVYDLPFNAYPDKETVENYLKENEAISHVAMVHCETTTGMLNPLEEVADLCKTYNKTFILDAMSSFGGVQMDMKALNVAYLISSANKCIQGVPGFSFVIAKKDQLMACKGQATSLVLDLVDQWEVMNKDGKWRYTSPTHVVAAFDQALTELNEEGGISARETRYKENNETLIEGMKTLGFRAYVDKDYQSPIITTFLFPNEDFCFNDFYAYVKERGYILYPGKLTDEDTFRVGNIGEIYKEDMDTLLDIIKSYMEEKHV